MDHLAAYRLRVSIHAPARGATCYDGRIKISEQVSIHAPARGATNNLATLGRLIMVSIHAPARGATGPAIAINDGAPGFNPRAREGRDLFL